MAVASSMALRCAYDLSETGVVPQTWCRLRRVWSFPGDKVQQRVAVCGTQCQYSSTAVLVIYYICGMMMYWHYHVQGEEDVTVRDVCCQLTAVDCYMLRYLGR